VKKHQEWEAANARVAVRPSEMKFKAAADGKMMGLTQFIEFATKFAGKTKAEANQFFNGHTVSEFNEFCRKIIAEDPVWEKPEEKEEKLLIPVEAIEEKD